MYTFSGTKALEDAGLTYDKIEQACVGYVYGMCSTYLPGFQLCIYW